MLLTERAITFTEAAAWIPRINGKKVHASTVWRWARRGIQGVRLDVRRVGRRFITSQEALDRFFAALAAVELPARPAASKEPRPVHPARRQREIKAAEEMLNRAGI